MTDAIPDCRIVWDEMDRAAWEEAFATVRRANLLQSYGYALAICPRHGQRARHGRILIDGHPAGLLQVLEARLLGRTLHALILDRGPLWFDGFGSAGHVQAFFRALDSAFPRRLGRRRRILPEVVDTPEMRAALDGTRLRRRADSIGYQTIWIDLSPDLPTLRARLKSQWRGHLSKGEAAGLQVGWCWDGTLLGSLLKGYAEDKEARGYPGPTLRTVTDLCRVLLPERRVLVGTAQSGGRVVASTLFLGHGRSATYQVGWTTPAGRANRATQLLLWQGMGALKDAGYLDLDLGGVNDRDAKAVKTFKEGLGGETVELIGQYE